MLPKTNLARLLIILWTAFAAVAVSGGKTVHFFRIGFALTLLLFAASPKRRKLWDELVAFFRRIVGKKAVAVTTALVAASVVASLIFDYESLNGTLWDLGQYVSAMRNMALIHEPIFYFHGQATSNYFNTHSSLSLFALAALYKVFDSAWVALIWQGLFLTAPAFLAMLWYRAVSLKQGLKPEPLAYLLAFLTYATTPVFLGQRFWPFTFHIASTVLLGLAYLFYFQKRWLAWAASLLALTVEKEDFGAISSTFGALVLIETAVAISKDRRSLKANLLPAAAAALICAAGVGFFVFYSSNFAKAVPFESKFGHLAQTPLQLVAAFFTRPLDIAGAFARPLSLKYAWFFFAASFLWLVPRWRAARFFVPVLPILVLNCLAVEGTMQMFKDHYAIPLAVGLSATLVLGVWTETLRRERGLSARAYGVFALTAFSPLLWQHETTFRHFKEAFGLWRAHEAEREILAPLRKDRSLVVCCEERLCAWLIERPLLLQHDACLRGSQHLNRYAGQAAVFVTYSGTKPVQSKKHNHAYAELPENWVAVTPYLRLSEPVPIKAPTQ